MPLNKNNKMKQTFIDRFWNWVLGRESLGLAQDWPNVPMPEMSVLSGEDIKKISIIECGIKNCKRPAIKRWRDTSEMFNICEFHQEICLKHIGED